MSRRYPERPVAAVGAVVIDADRVLLVRRGQAPLQGEWSLPGGAVEIGETLADAVGREVLEETGLAVEVGPVVGAVDRLQHDPDGRLEYHYVIIDYLCAPGTGRLVPDSDADDARWVNLSELRAYRLTEQTAVMIRKAVEIHRSRGFHAK